MVRNMFEKNRTKVELLESVLLDAIELGVAEMSDSTKELKKTLKQYEIYDASSKRYITLWDYYKMNEDIFGKALIFKVTREGENLIAVDYARCPKSWYTCWLYVDYFIPEKRTRVI